MKIKTISDQLIFSTIRIEAKNEKNQYSIGTGFLIHKNVNSEYAYIFLVTCKHVIEKTKNGRIFFIKKENDEPVLGKSVNIYFNDFESQWIVHKKEDLAILPLAKILNELNINQGFDPFYKSIPLESLTDSKKEWEFDSLEEIIFIGYPIGLYDSKNLLPISRRGTTATPFFIDYEGEKKFLIDASVFPGSSGSPVFIYNKGIYIDRDNVLNIGNNRVYFAGILSGVYKINDKYEIKSISIPSNSKSKIIYSQLINLGIVIKSSLIKEFIEQYLNDLIK
jgi:hypothetical protein